ncbi:MAG: YbaK/EbsC family protein [Patescibacteria group bacterium]
MPSKKVVKVKKGKGTKPTAKAAPKKKEHPASKQLVKYLDKSGIKYELVPHRKVFTAYDLAQTVGAKLDEIAKSLLVKVELPEIKKKGSYFVVVVPASYNVDLQKVKKTLKATKVELAPEKIFKKFGLEPGAVSPFGSQRDFGVLVDKGMLKAKQAIVGAESFIESIRLKAKDLVDLEEAVVDCVSKKNTLKLQKSGGQSKGKKSVKKVAKKISTSKKSVTKKKK